MKKINLILILFFLYSIGFAQVFPKKAIMEKLKAKQIMFDEGNGDGVFKAQNKNTKKWGMYQWLYDGTNVKVLIPMEYDNLKYFPFNAPFTAVYIDKKVGFYLAEWSYGEKAIQSVPCIYDEFQKFNNKGVTYLAVTKKNKWGWVNWLTGKEESEFIYDTKEELPYPYFEQKSWLDN